MDKRKVKMSILQELEREEAQYDEHVKRSLSNRYILVWILKLIPGVLVAGIIFGSTGCGEKIEQGSNLRSEKPVRGSAVNLMTDIEASADENSTAGMNDIDEDNNIVNMELFREDTADFSIALLQKNLESGEKNVMVSPISVLTALSMTANGAQGDTLAQMQQVLGKNQNIEQLNQNIKAWTDSLVNTEKTAVKIANSIWFKDDEEKIQVQGEFLKKNAAYYSADIFKAPFDNSTLTDINGWVSEKTEGRITDILTDLPDDAVMYLVNALAFDGEWQSIYFENEIHDGIFHVSADEEETVPFMYGEENIYLQDENATGFIKPYKEGYSFVALLPQEGMSPADYVASLDGEGFLKLLEGQKYTTVQTALPKFEKEYEIEMKDILSTLGMTDAFDEEKADFSKLGVSNDGNIYMNRVLHKTFISVDEKGTEAGAATVVEMVCETALEVEESYQVYLNRPFVYAIIENETNIPLFIGTVDSIGTQN